MSIASAKHGLMRKFFKSGELKNVLISLSTILIYYCFSIFLTFYNRHLFVTYKYPLSITLVHLIFKFGMSALIRTIQKCWSTRRKRMSCSSSPTLSSMSSLSSSPGADTLKHRKRIVLDWSTYCRRIVPTGIASAADIGFSNWSLQYITISLYTMSKSTVILFIFFFSIWFKLEKWVRELLCTCFFPR